MKPYPKVFIVVLNYNGKEVLKNCLASLFNITYPNFEVIVADNNSEDGSLEEARLSYSKVHYIKNDENIGFSAGNNVGIRYALEKGAQYVLLLNNDAEAGKDFLDKLVEVAEKDRKAGLVSPVIFRGKTKEVWFAGGKINWFRMRNVHQTKVKSAEPYETSFISGCAMLVRASVFKKIGLLDEDYFLYCEDVDFSLRARRANFDLMVVPSSQVYHFEKSEGRKKEKTYWLVISGLIFFKKNTPLWLSPWISLYTLLRRIKNFIDVRWRRNDLAVAVEKAYKDLKYV